jgi:Ca2+-binding EF-hand superfamily protein
MFGGTDGKIDEEEMKLRMRYIDKNSDGNITSEEVEEFQKELLKASEQDIIFGNCI